MFEQRADYVRHLGALHGAARLDALVQILGTSIVNRFIGSATSSPADRLTQASAVVAGADRILMATVLLMRLSFPIA